LTFALNFSNGLLEWNGLIARSFGGVVGANGRQLLQLLKQFAVILQIQEHTNTVPPFIHHVAFFEWEHFRLPPHVISADP
jgi:hypothetical protein